MGLCHYLSLVFSPALLLLLQKLTNFFKIIVIGRDNCLDHHRHANELTRIAHANDHINFYDCVGRLAERLVVADVLKRVYASSAPGYEELMDPKYDLPGYSTGAAGGSGGKGGKGKN